MKAHVKYTAIAGLALITGCSTGVIPMDQGTYMASRTSPGGAVVSGSAVLSDLYIEANAYCDKKGQAVETIDKTVTNGIVFVRPSSASLHFRCVPRV